MSRNTRNKKFELNSVDARDGLGGLLSEEDVLGAQRALRKHYESGQFYGNPSRSTPVPPTRTLEEISEPWLTAGSAIAGLVPSGLGGIAAGAMDAARGGEAPLETFGRTVGGIQDDLTYLPRTVRGQEDLLSALKWIEEIPYLKEATELLEVPGEKTMEATGSPLLAGMVDVIPDALEMAVGAPHALGIARKVSKQLGRLDPGVVGSRAAKMGGNQTGGIGGRNAQGLNPGTAKMADDMRATGASPDDIWQATGDAYGQPAFFDKANMFGFEFDDSKAAYLAQPRSFEQDVLDLGDRITPAERGRLMELRNKYHNRTWQETLEFKNKTDELGMLSDYGSMRAHFQHPEIDKHYPTLLDDIKYREGALDGAFGEFNANTNTVTVDPSRHTGPDDLRSTTLHEFSGHAVQDKAKLPRGGSPREFAQEEQMGKIRINGFLERAKDADNMGFADVAEDYREKARRIQASIYADPRTPEAKYFAISGEAGARAIEARRNMTMDERLARPFWLDFDDRGLMADQIVKYR